MVAGLDIQVHNHKWQKNSHFCNVVLMTKSFHIDGEVHCLECVFEAYVIIDNWFGNARWLLHAHNITKC